MRILVPTAGPTPARNHAEYIMKIARALGASVDVIHICKTGDDDRPGKEALDVFKDASAKLDISITTHLVYGDVVQTILDYSKERDTNLIVMGASEGRVAAQWLASNLLPQAEVPVFIIPDGFSHLVENF